MNRVLTGVSALAFAASFAAAGETFGGIGITIYGAPAACRSWMSFRVLPRPNPVSNPATSSAPSTAQPSRRTISGVQGRAPRNGGQTLELSVVREKDTLSVTLRRVQLAVKDLDAGKVSRMVRQSEVRVQRG